MSETMPNVQPKVQMQFAVAPQQMADVSGAVEIALNTALAVTAESMGLHSPQLVADLVRAGDRAASEYLHYNLAGEIGKMVGAWDGDVQAAYLCNYEATPEDWALGEVRSPLVHMLLVVGRKTSALQSLLEAVDNCLVLIYRDLIERPELTHLLDVQVVDREDVRNRRGYGALLASLYNRPIPVWTR